MTPLRWAWNVLVWLDIGINVVLLASHDVESLSKRAAKARNKGRRWGCVLCRLLDAVARDHCTKALSGP